MMCLIVDGKELTENERFALLRTIEGDVDPDALDYVSCLKPKPLPVDTEDEDNAHL